ncbi:MAG: type II secretion system protein [Cyanobacteria bacterium SIG30]|nr:type II secretion system protein [Cyanobacteria bacterium SIG30]
MKKINLNYGGGASRSLKAFTLAEVLITLAIIGVVAALTIPSVITNYKNQEIATTLKKAYSMLASTSNLAIKDYGPVSGWNIPEGYGIDLSVDFAEKYIIPYLRVSKTCGTSNEGDCEYKYIRRRSNGTPSTVSLASYFTKFYLANGTLVGVASQSFGEGAGKHVNAMYYIDTNGKNAPNELGKDLFIFNHLLVFNGKDFGGKLLPNCNYDENMQCSLSVAIKDASGCKKGGALGTCAYLIMQNGWKIPNKDEYVRMAGDESYRALYPW